MTKEKAIELLDIIRSVEGDIIVDNELRDAIDVALQALSQQEQSCDTCTNDKGCVTCKDGELWEGKEQPSEGYDEAYLNEKIAKASKTWKGVDVDKYMAEMRGYEQPSEDLEEAADNYAEKHGFRVPYDGSNNFYDDVDVKASKDGFKAGAEWQEKQDLKWAGEIHKNGYNLCKEQMSMLLAVIRDPNNAGSESCSLAFQSLYEDLRKLI